MRERNANPIVWQATRTIDNTQRTHAPTRIGQEYTRRRPSLWFIWGGGGFFDNDAAVSVDSMLRLDY